MHIEGSLRLEYWDVLPSAETEVQVAALRLISFMFLFGPQWAFML